VIRGKGCGIKPVPASRLGNGNQAQKLLIGKCSQVLAEALADSLST
jgi:hypothetical protein